MALILNIETSSPVCSVNLAENGNLIDFREDRQGNGHARLLTVFIDEVLRNNQTTYAQLDAIAVSAGPGSYTGLRIGASVAKGLCYALNKPLISVPTLLALSGEMQQRADKSDACYMPAIDARRMDIYTAIFDNEENELLKSQMVTIDKMLEDTLIKYGNIYIGGNAVQKCKEIFTCPQIHYIEGVNFDSRLLIKISEIKYKQAAFENLSGFQPVYLKDFGLKS